MCKIIFALISAFALVVAGPALAQTVSVQPITLQMGGPSIHKTPLDQNGNVIDIALCTMEPGGQIPRWSQSLATATKDATGYVFTAAAFGSGRARWACTNQGSTVLSADFVVSVPWNVTAVGDRVD